jgi:hypothetical protein
MDLRLVGVFVASFVALLAFAKLTGGLSDPRTGKGTLPLLAAMAGVSMLLVLVVKDADARRRGEQAAEIEPIEYQVLTSWHGTDARLDTMVTDAMRDRRIVESEMTPIRARLRIVQSAWSRDRLLQTTRKAPRP